MCAGAPRGGSTLTHKKRRTQTGTRMRGGSEWRLFPPRECVCVLGAAGERAERKRDSPSRSLHMIGGSEGARSTRRRSWKAEASSGRTSSAAASASSRGSRRGSSASPSSSYQDSMGMPFSSWKPKAWRGNGREKHGSGSEGERGQTARKASAAVSPLLSSLSLPLFCLSPGASCPR